MYRKSGIKLYIWWIITYKHKKSYFDFDQTSNGSECNFAKNKLC